MVEYDSVVNQFFLPVIKQEFDEPKEKLEKEITEQKNRLERIRKAYIGGAFPLNVYKEETAIVEKAIKKLESELNKTDCSEELRFTPKDILLKRDIDYINKLKLNKEYQERTKTCKDYTREEQADLIMRYVNEIKLALVGKEVTIDEINFRDSICKLCQELYDNGYIDATKPMFCFNFTEDNSAIVRVFPLKDYYKLDPEGKMPTYAFGIIYINEEDKF